ncbi:MAG: LytR C-terminal domain-containing protein [Butyribacter sp.]|nr:LytR C-terminal domain-containing protein [bacterium]MDY3854110.1 LytR C-terminal domain-containing protein [Butyribacter sp.]
MSLLKSLLCIVIILGVGLISYKISYTVLSKSSDGLSTDSDNLKDIMDEATTDEISKNLIYVSDDKNKITHLMLEICNTKTYNMDYITIPVRTDYTIPSVMYRKLCQVNQEIPQVIRVSKLKQYFENEDDAYGYGVLIFEKMLGTDISYYTAISEETYENHYTEQKVKVAYKAKSSINNTPGPDGTTPESNTTIKTKMKISVLSEAYTSQLKDLGSDQEKIADYIKDQYERVSSNLTVFNKIGYLEAYQKMNVDYYHYWGVPGTYSGKVFEVDTKATKKALKQLTGNETAYTQAQDLTAKNMISEVVSSSSDEEEDDDSEESTESSKGLKIYVLNGSQIGGLASKTKQKLEEEGYTVPKIGNYTDETLTRTRIVVSKKGQGEDLKEYFSDPEITTGDVTSGYDIEIILGTADAN